MLFMTIVVYIPGEIGRNLCEVARLCVFAGCVRASVPFGRYISTETYNMRWQMRDAALGLVHLPLNVLRCLNNNWFADGLFGVQGHQHDGIGWCTRTLVSDFHRPG